MKEIINKITERKEILIPTLAGMFAVGIVGILWLTDSGYKALLKLAGH